MADIQDTIVAITPEENKKVCADCKHLIGVRYTVEEAHKRWNCGHPNNDTGDWKNDLVTGLRYKIFRLTPIWNVRYSPTACNGNWWEKYEPPQHYTGDPEKGQIAKIKTGKITAEDL